MAYSPIASLTTQMFVPGGRLYWSPLDASEDPTGYTFFGEVDDFNLTIESETIQEFTARDGLKELLDETALGATRTAELTVKQFSLDNLALFLAATKVTETQTSGTVTNEDIVITAVDRYYQLGRTDANPKGVRSVSALTFAIKEGETASGWVTDTVTALGAFVKQSAVPTHYFEATSIGSPPHKTGTPEPTWNTTLGATTTDADVTWTCRGLITPVVTTDYTIDTTLGWIYIPLASRIYPGHSLRVDYTKALVYRPTLTTGASAATTVSLRLISNPIKGTAYDYLFPKCNLAPTGALTLIAGEPGYNSMKFQLGVLKPSAGSGGQDIAAIYVDGRPVS